MSFSRSLDAESANPDDLERLQGGRAGAKPLRYFPKAPLKKEYVILPEKLARDDNALAPWIEESIRYTRARAGTG
ncbi:MAG: hypothetical protein KAJ11_12450 [Alphaproteobacteria bacterium]|nr:hypothetical protein [Alphaproteobacteria bacterium]